jgi:hypothetical protein
MLYYLVAALLLAHAVFWGAGLSLLALPRNWRPVWWVFAAPFGWALQSAVVWFAAYTPLRGTDTYALATQAIPVALLVLALRRRGGVAAPKGLPATLPPLVLAGLLLLWPLAQRGGWTLTTSSLGTNDHADYAAGARVLGEFARTDRVGFLDLPEVTQVGRVERFFDYWLELNHFTPAAILAHNGSVFQLEPHQLISVSSAVLWLAVVPLVLLVARAAGWRRRRILPVVLVAVSPVAAYGVHQAAMGQMLATMGVVLATLAAQAAARASGRAVWRMLPVAFVASWLLAGSYNFILLIAFVPALAGVALPALVRRDPRPVWRAGALLFGAVAACALVFPGRFVGLAERFRLFERYDFGWPVPLLTPEGWLGVVGDAQLGAWAGWRGPLAVGAVLVLLLGLRAVRRETALRLAGWVLAVGAGWAVLAWESRTRVNASYDAYKVVAVFLPLLGPALLVWCGAARTRWAWAVGASWCALAAVGALAVAAAMVHPPLRVDRALLDLRRIEQMPQVESLNVRVDRFWSRLWANALLLRKPQYFATHTYEGRLNTALRGGWDLRDSPLRSLPVKPADGIVLNFRFHLVRAGAPGLVELGFGANWYPIERDSGGRWRWAGQGPATVLIDNPGNRPVRAQLEMRGRATERRGLVVRLGSAKVGRVPLRRDWQTVNVGTIVVPPGSSVLTLATAEPAEPAARDDPRLVSFALSELTVRALDLPPAEPEVDD